MGNLRNILTLVFVVLLCSCSEDTIDDSATGTLTGTVVLQGSNEPVVNARISTNPVSSTVFTDNNGDFVITDISAGNYSVQAQKDSLIAQFEAVTIVSNATANVVFEMQPQSALNEAPLTPNLISPNDNSTGLSNSVTFTWSSSNTEDEDDINYTLKIRKADNTEILEFEDITDTTFTVDGLAYGTTYFWQVKASDNVAPVVWSEVYSFTTEGFPETRILFTRLINGNNVIFALDAQGNEYKLTSATMNSFRPRRNNNVGKIAFLRTVDGQAQLFTMEYDGSNIMQVTSTIPVRGFNLTALDFSWSDNGNSLVYPNFDKLYKVNSTGGGNQLLYQTPDGRFISEVDVSENNAKLAILVNNSIGYNAAIYIIDNSGSITNTVVENLPGALGGLDFSVDGQKLLYTRDISGFENFDYRQLDNRIFIYNTTTNTSTDISEEKDAGTNDLDPRFSPNEAQVIFVNTDNDGVSQRNLFTSGLTNGENTREELHENARMPDWE